MAYDRFKTIPGIPGDENTAVTMRAIQDILDEEGAAHLLMRREPTEEKEQPQETAEKPAPLRQLAEEAQQKPALQTPPRVKSVGKAAFPTLSTPADETEEEKPMTTTQRVKSGLLQKVFNRK